MSNNDDYILTTLKILIIGESGVGKSCLLLRFTDDTFHTEMPATIGVDFKVKQLEVDENRVKLAIWIIGRIIFNLSFFLLPSTYVLSFFWVSGAHGAILVYDVCNRNSFQQLDRWIAELNTFSTKLNIIKMLVGNKIDCQDSREITREEGAKFARKYSMLFIETSARTREGVQIAFEELVQKILQTPSLWQNEQISKRNTIYLDDNENFNQFSQGCYC
ncbi:unnamed protein product [Rotaria sp. Silwood1]|nr:unnamed protein product [Rotaria sp. Silwood1]